MAKFRTVVKEVDAEQWSTAYLPKNVTPKSGIMEVGFVYGADGKKRECKQGDFIIQEIGGAYPMEEREFRSRFELIEKLPELPPVDQIPDLDQTPTTGDVSFEGDASEVQS